MRFLHREDAGKKLAAALSIYRDYPKTLIIGLPRGGVVVAYEVAQALRVPLDVICPRKVGAPNNPELAIGAVTHTGEGYFNEELIIALNVSNTYIQSEMIKEMATPGPAYIAAAWPIKTKIPAPTMAPWPIVTPGRTTALTPSHEPLPTVTGPRLTTSYS